MKAEMASHVLLNLRVIPVGEAKVSVSDRGFLFGDGIYETLRVYGGCPFLLDEHLLRLRESGRSIYLDLPWSDGELKEGVRELLETNRISEGRMRITVTRGIGDVRARPHEMKDPLLVIRVEHYEAPAEDYYETGVKVEIADRFRNLPAALDPAVKSGNFLNNLLARFEMKREDSFEILLPNHRGELTEGSLSNLFLVDERGKLLTPSPESGLLLGITRSHVLEIARSEGLDLRECTILPRDLREASEAFLTASTLEILPIAFVEEKRIGEPGMGPVTAMLREAYRREVLEYCHRKREGKKKPRR
ncbi:MAG: aminotransferase class IV [Candidatus Krumholzibacteria bacterium]|jgi:branched-chain amino acid aminotransferase|nr:aminotransferase class IV [Candidatus Krumholzibacteria bacterium]MDP6668760.1 aminotransferase class IV [Candidatus Krumholzibacteria bacterium]MDP6797511.1 aminotransferase class IV [Candidatus Krumholzibacteria bacterium]MDP7021506.1 aminotransferase class IV [Candidatus Krumholzibacteria bacterium]